MPQILPIKELKNTSEISELCHKTDEPIYITKNGYGDMVIMSIELFDNVTKRLAMYQSLLASEKNIEEGKFQDARASLSSLLEKNEL